MQYFISIQLLADAEFPTTILMNAIYVKFHKALNDLQSTCIAVSFPKVKATLGSELRLHGKEKDLSQLQGKDWLGGMKGYCELSEIVPIPDAVKYRSISRKQSNMSSAKLRRLIKRGSISEEAAKDYTARMNAREPDKPYIELRSESNGQRYRRYIEFGELQDTPVEGLFDQFGLATGNTGRKATVPWF